MFYCVGMCTLVCKYCHYGRLVHTGNYSRDLQVSYRGHQGSEQGWGSEQNCAKTGLGAGIQNRVGAQNRTVSKQGWGLGFRTGSGLRTELCQNRAGDWGSEQGWASEQNCVKTGLEPGVQNKAGPRNGTVKTGLGAGVQNKAGAQNGAGAQNRTGAQNRARTLGM